MSRITIEEAMSILDVTSRTIHNHVKRGNLAIFKAEANDEIFFYIEEVNELKVKLRERHGMTDTRLYNIWKGMKKKM